MYPPGQAPPYLYADYKSEAKLNYLMIPLLAKFGLNNIFIEGGGNYGFLNIQKGSQNGKNNTGAATAVVGYSHWFGQ
jgi:hypothetical protein